MNKNRLLTTHTNEVKIVTSLVEFLKALMIPGKLLTNETIFQKKHPLLRPYNPVNELLLTIAIQTYFR